MKELINIENWGVRLYYIEPIDCDLLIEWRDAYKQGQYLFEYDDTCAPVEHQVHYKTLEEALDEIAHYILNPKNVYAIEELSVPIQVAYDDVHDCQPAANAAYQFVYLVLEGIANANMRRKN